MTKTASALLTPDEVRAMIKACSRSMDRAIITMLYEGDSVSAKLGPCGGENIKFDHYGVIINVNFKTGIPRYVRIIMGKEYLAQWRHDYPGSAEGFPWYS
jgi:integrase